MKSPSVKAKDVKLGDKIKTHGGLAFEVKQVCPCITGPKAKVFKGTFTQPSTGKTLWTSERFFDSENVYLA